MRLLYVIDSLAPGGAEISLAEMAPELVRRGIELHVLPLGPKLDLKDRLRSVGAEVHDGPERATRRSFIAHTVRVASLVRPQLVHTTLYEANISGRVAAQICGVPSSTSLVGDTYGRHPVGRAARTKLAAARLVDRTTARFASRFHAVSKHLAVAATHHLGLSADRIDVIPRGRDAQRFPYKPMNVRFEVRRELGIPVEAPVVIAVGRLEKVKGLEHLMHALPQLGRLVPDMQILVAGKDGAAGAEIRAAAARSNVPVTFLGHRRDVGRLLAAADVLAFPSLSEGSPGTLIEALATGCPIVASDIPPNLEVLNGRSAPFGITVPVGNSAALAHALGSVLHRPLEAADMAMRGRSRFEDTYEITAVAARMAEFFDSVSVARARLGGRPHGRT